MNRTDITAALFAVALAGFGPSAIGAAGEWGPDVVVTPLQPNVTYSEAAPVLNTYAGFTVTGFGNIGINTINDVTVIFEARVTDTAETFSLHQPDVYLAGLPKTCSWPTVASNPVTITCEIKQLKSGETFPGFTVFYNVPTKMTNGVADDPTADYISTKYTILYAEQLNDCSNGCANSRKEQMFPDQVLLGTSNPVDVRSGVPQNGARLFTGTGVPKNELNKKFTEELQVPSLASLTPPVAYAKSTLLISYVASTDTTNGVDCLQLGNFHDCPTYATQVLDPYDATVAFTVANPLKIIYRVDAANVRRSANQLFNNVQILYFPDGSTTAVPVPKACTNGRASDDGIPCVLSFQCYKPNEKTPDLPGDCEFVTIGLKNGRLTLQ